MTHHKRAEASKSIAIQNKPHDPTQQATDSPDRGGTQANPSASTEARENAMTRTRTQAPTITINAQEATSAGAIDWIALANKAKADAATRSAKKEAKATATRQPSLSSRFLTELVTSAPNGIEVPLTGAIALWLSAQPEGTTGGGKTPDASIAAQIYTARKAGTLPARVSLDKRGAQTWIVIGGEA